MTDAPQHHPVTFDPATRHPAPGHPAAEPDGSAARFSRRRALTGAATLGLATPVLAACGGDGSSDTAAEPATTAPASPSSEGPLAATSDVPVGSGVILEDEGVVLTQPAEGEFKGFTNICTHQGCPVTSVEDGTINCSCHGSKFSIETGEVEAGPAPSPLPSVEVTVDGDQIALA